MNERSQSPGLPGAEAQVPCACPHAGRENVCHTYGRLRKQAEPGGLLSFLAQGMVTANTPSPALQLCELSSWHHRSVQKVSLWVLWDSGHSMVSESGRRQAPDALDRGQGRLYLCPFQIASADSSH